MLDQIYYLPGALQRSTELPLPKRQGRQTFLMYFPDSSCTFRIDWMRPSASDDGLDDTTISASRMSSWTDATLSARSMNMMRTGTYVQSLLSRSKALEASVEQDQGTV